MKPFLFLYELISIKFTPTINKSQLFCMKIFIKKYIQINLLNQNRFAIVYRINGKQGNKHEK